MRKMNLATWNRILGATAAIAGLALVLAFGPRYWRAEFGSPSERLEIMWEEDLAKLQQSKQLPPGWKDIKEIQLIPATDSAKLWLKTMKIPITLKSTGEHKLEVLMLSWEEGASAGAIIQYNLVELKSGNMIWELGRTFTLSGEASKAPTPAVKK